MNKFLLLIFWLPCLALIPLLTSQRTYGADAANVRLVGHSDLQGRDALQVVLKGNYAYVGHHRGRERNPMTGALEWNGTTILDVSNPKQPRIIKHIPGYEGAESRAVQVVEKYFDGRDYLLRNQESSHFTGFEVWDITDRPSPRLVSKIEGLNAAHKGWWDAKTGYAYLSGISPGWKGQHLIIYDLKNPYIPKFVSNWGLPGQAPGGQGSGVSLHHPVISGDRAYLSYLRGGDVVILDINLPDINGFDVMDLGVDVPAAKFVEAVKSFKPQVVGLSGFLTLAYDPMKNTVQALKDAGLRDSVKIMIGGGQMDDQVAAYAKADAYGKDAMAAVTLSKGWVGAK